MGTVFPSGILISFSTPAEGEGISASTLSVEISKRGSWRSAFSPGVFHHLVMVALKMVSPIWGMTASTAMRELSFALPGGSFSTGPTHGSTQGRHRTRPRDVCDFPGRSRGEPQNATSLQRKVGGEKFKPP